MTFIIDCLIGVLIWFLILATGGFISWLKDIPRRKKNNPYLFRHFYEYVSSISKDTGVNFYRLINRR